MRRANRAFTLVELLLVIAAIALLIGLALPSLAGARTRARTMLCGARLEQLATATTAYLNDFNGALPQMLTPMADGSGPQVMGTLFGGKKGAVPLCDADTTGPERRPLNAYVRGDSVPRDSEDLKFEMEAFRSPMDHGAEQTYLSLPDWQRTDSIYEMWGTSYVVNDHGLDSDYQRTLIPAGGGRMPFILDATKTWMLASHTIYNFQSDSDRGEHWYDSRQAQANLAFVDGHVRLVVPIPDIPCQVENTTPDYTFLPTPERY